MYWQTCLLLTGFMYHALHGCNKVLYIKTAGSGGANSAIRSAAAAAFPLFTNQMFINASSFSP